MKVNKKREIGENAMQVEEVMKQYLLGLQLCSTIRNTSVAM
jgi:hypothetical protein